MIGYLLIVGGATMLVCFLGAAITDLLYPVKRAKTLAFFWGFFHPFHDLLAERDARVP